MTGKKRRVVALVVALCIVLGSMSAAFAGENIADLTKTMKWKFSASYFGGVKKAYITSGWNDSSSAHAVYFIHAVYDSASSAQTPSEYTQDTLRLIPVGGKVESTIPSSSFSTNKYFRILLNPYGENTTGCFAHGVQRDSQ